jgi:hypothetical protein
MSDFSRKPMYLLTIVSKDKEKRSRTQAGALFESSIGMNLVLNPGVVLTRELQEKYYLNVVPYESDRRDVLPREKPVDESPGAAGSAADLGNDPEIPF